MSDYHDSHHATPEEQAKVFARVRKLRIAMLTTQTEDGTLESRPMTLQDIDDDGAMWFFTSAYTSLEEAIRREAQVNVAFADTSDSFYLSTSAHAVFVDDREKVEALWSPMAAAWFPGRARGSEPAPVARGRREGRLLAEPQRQDRADACPCEGRRTARATGSGRGRARHVHASGRPARDRDFRGNAVGADAAPARCAVAARCPAAGMMGRSSHPRPPCPLPACSHP